jgi:hypothetical protein
VLRRQIFNGTRLGWDFETWKLRGHQLLIKSAQMGVFGNIPSYPSAGGSD